MSKITPPPADQSYAGNELTIFKHAHHWKQYYGRQIAPYLTGRVLEVGAGIGGTTPFLCDGSQSEWVCLEPDAAFARDIQLLIDSQRLPACCRVFNGVLTQMEGRERFNAIVYVDVLEHIEDDRNELEAASSHLAPGGVLVIVAPAHSWLSSPFDKAIGHFRRYDRIRLEAIIPAPLKLRKLLYLDSVGVLLSLFNRIFLRQVYPSENQILFWDRWVIGASSRIDPVLRYSFGKSVIGIFVKT